MRRERSIDSAWFEALYREQGDPWAFETSPYEQAKYDRTIAALGDERSACALEVGCANGVLTARLAARCDALLAVDVSATALAAARGRCAGLSHVTFAERRLPAEGPVGPFDLVVLSEVIYYWDSADLRAAADYLLAQTPAGARLLLVHWTGETDYPKSGDDAVDELRLLLGDTIDVVAAERHPSYRLDLWRRRARGAD